jgi:hypothetical protein
MANDRSLCSATRLIATVILAASAAGCASPAPTLDPTIVLHVENRIGTPVVLGINSRADPSKSIFRTTIPACGGRFDARPGVDGVPATEWRIGMAADVTGTMEADMRAWDANPAQVKEPVPGLAIMWTTGEIDAPDLPRWITITPTDVTVTTKPDTSPVPSTCPAWAYPVEPTPEP